VSVPQDADRQLGMTSVEVLPCEALRPYVQLIWCFEVDAAGGPPEVERIAPDGVVELVFHYRDPVAFRFAGDAFAPLPRGSAVTLTRRFAEICPRAPTGFLSVRFRPWGAHHFVGLPISELADRLVPADALWGSASRELEERLAGATSMPRRVSLVERFLIARLRAHHDAEVEPIVRAVWRRRGDVRVAQLCAELGLTERTLERIFSRAVGMPPKSFIRLTRFLQACSHLRRGDWDSLTRLACECGYYDQAHFIADVKAFSGMTPGELADAPSFSFLEPG
jgi:AraC-like DNA-binding protein